MAEGVVDLLEVVQVEQQQRERPRGVGLVAERRGHTFVQEGAVGQARQGVVPGLVAQRLLRPHALGDILHRAAQPHRSAPLVAHDLRLRV